MNKIDDAWQVLKKLPPEEQERVAEAIIDFAERSGNLRLSAEQVAEVERRLVDKDAKTLTAEEFRARVRTFGTQ